MMQRTIQKDFKKIGQVGTNPICPFKIIILICDIFFCLFLKIANPSLKSSSDKT